MYSKSEHLERNGVWENLSYVFFHGETANLLEDMVAAAGNARKEVFLRASRQLFCVCVCLKNIVKPNKPNNIVFYCICWVVVIFCGRKCFAFSAVPTQLFCPI